MKDTLHQLVRVIYKDRHPLKSEPDVVRYVETVHSGFIEDWIWLKILDKMYEPEES